MATLSSNGTSSVAAPVVSFTITAPVARSRRAVPNAQVPDVVTAS
jgi:hypothetical protein